MVRLGWLSRVRVRVYVRVKSGKGKSEGSVGAWCEVSLFRRKQLGEFSFLILVWFCTRARIMNDGPRTMMYDMHVHTMHRYRRECLSYEYVRMMGLYIYLVGLRSIVYLCIK